MRVRGEDGREGFVSFINILYCRIIPKVTTLVTFSFSSSWKLLSGGHYFCGICYFQLPSFVCKCKEISMTHLYIWESHGFFIVSLLLHSAIFPPSFSSAFFSRNFLWCFFRPFFTIAISYTHGVSIPPPWTQVPSSTPLDCPVTLTLWLFFLEAGGTIQQLQERNIIIRAFSLTLKQWLLVSRGRYFQVSISSL